MKINVNNAQVNFANGKLALQYFSVSFSAGDFPNNINGNLQITSDDGVTIASSEEEVATAAKAKILALVNEPAADTTASDTKS